MTNTSKAFRPMKFLRCIWKGHRWTRSISLTEKNRTAWQRCGRCNAARRMPG